jgi:hypothetical protein
MAIPDALLTRDILTAPYYDGYIKLLKVSQDASAIEQSQSTKSGKTPSKNRKGVSASAASSGSIKKVKRTTGSKKPSSKKSMSKESDPEDTPNTEQIQLTEAEMIQKATEESLKDVYMPPVPPFSGVSINEPESGKLKQLQHVEGRGKEVATEEQAAQTLLKISSPASKSTTSQFILKRRSPEPSNVIDSSDKTMPHSPSLVQQPSSSESETDTNSSQKGDDSTLRDVTSDNPITDEAGVIEKPLDPLHDEFVSTAYPNIQGNLKLMTDDPKLAVEPDSSTGILDSFKNLDTYGDQFLVDKPNESEVE